MTFSAIKHITYAAAGGYTVGIIGGYALFKNFAKDQAGRAYSYFGHTGMAVAATALVAKAVDELFKALGWTGEATGRLLLSHVVVALALYPAISLLVGDPTMAAKVVTAALVVASFAVNLIIG